MSDGGSGKGRCCGETVERRSGYVGQASGMERWTVGDLGDRGLDPEALEIDLPRGARGGCSAKRNVGWGAAEWEKGTIQC